MIKRVINLIIIYTLLFTNTVYPLSSSSLLRDPAFRKSAWSLLSVLSYVKYYPNTKIREFSVLYGVKVEENETGIWLNGDGWKARFYKEGVDGKDIIDGRYKLAFRDVIEGKLKVEIYFESLSDEDKALISAFLKNNKNVSALCAVVLREMRGDGGGKSLSFGDVDEERDIHEAIRNAEGGGRLFKRRHRSFFSLKRKDAVEKGFDLIDEIIDSVEDDKIRDELKRRKYVIIKEENGSPTIFYREYPFKSVLSHSGKSTNTIYIGLNTLNLVNKTGRRRYKNALMHILLHENRDINRGYHVDFEDEVKIGDLKHGDADVVHILWYDLITKGMASKSYDLYKERANDDNYEELFLNIVPASIRLFSGDNLYGFQHRDGVNLPDLIKLNRKIFNGTCSLETIVFLMRHCTDRIRYDTYKTMINDAKYALTISDSERERIFGELNGEKEFKFLKETLYGYAKGRELEEGEKIKMREYDELRFEDYTAPDGARVHYTVGGNLKAKRTLVFLHGVTVNSRDWRTQITYLQDKYKIITIDLRGFGKSKGLGTSPPDIKNYARDVEGILDREKIDNATVMGHSMGGMVALNLEEIYKDIPIEKRRVKKIVLIATVASNPLKNFRKPVRDAFLALLESKPFGVLWKNGAFQWTIRTSPYRRGLYEIAEFMGIVPRKTNPLFSRKAISSVFKSDPKSIAYAFKAMQEHNKEKDLCNIKISVLWEIGGGDKGTYSSEQIEQAAKIKNCKYEVLEDAGHYPHLTKPRRINKAIDDFNDDNTYSFTRLLEQRVKKRYVIDISFDDLSSEIHSLKIRLTPHLHEFGVQGAIINEIAGMVMACGEEAGVSHETMVKAVIIIASKVIPGRVRVTMPSAKPFTREELEERYKAMERAV